MLGENHHSTIDTMNRLERTRNLKTNHISFFNSFFTF